MKENETALERLERRQAEMLLKFKDEDFIRRRWLEPNADEDNEKYMKDTYAPRMYEFEIIWNLVKKKRLNGKCLDKGPHGGRQVDVRKFEPISDIGLKFIEEFEQNKQKKSENLKQLENDSKPLIKVKNWLKGPPDRLLAIFALIVALCTFISSCLRDSLTNKRVAALEESHKELELMIESTIESSTNIPVFDETTNHE